MSNGDLYYSNGFLAAHQESQQQSIHSMANNPASTYFRSLATTQTSETPNKRSQLAFNNFMNSKSNNDIVNYPVNSTAYENYFEPAVNQFNDYAWKNTSRQNNQFSTMTYNY